MSLGTEKSELARGSQGRKRRKGRKGRGEMGKGWLQEEEAKERVEGGK